ncbi:hypothetical protein CSA56_07745 [candidate division KSB3 bacterium]|uniref:DUF340 domain-containing protein n=1 Tax=candidate division KSB3 bacterium TaxID=2044937 RepID=A0A2G6KF32_9BACT|nr:MAG: hypothetical protein CSA56_07745 [candidate division KSB3 bacterium]
MAALDWEKLGSQLNMLIFVGLITLIGQKCGFGISPITALPGMIIVLLIGIIALALKRLVPLKIPAFAYASLIALVLTVPWNPLSAAVLKYTNEVHFLGTTTPILAYAGISIGLQVLEIKRVGWKLVLVAFCVFLGTFFGSAIIAQIVLKLQGLI